MSGLSIHLFRKGLRLHDNPALLESIKNAKHFLPLYILDPIHHDKNKVSANRLGFLLKTLEALDSELQSKGSKLYVAQGKPLTVMKKVIKTYEPKLLSFECDTEPYNLKVDQELVHLAKSADVDVVSKWSHTLHEPDYLLKLNGGKTPMQMTAFTNLMAKAKAPEKPKKTPSKFPGLPGIKKDSGLSKKVPKLDDLGYDPKKYTTWFIAGEKEGLKRMKKFLADKKRTAEFEKPKTLPTALEPDTTALSPYISNGSLSARTFWHSLQEAISGAKNKSKPPVSLEGQLMWREMAYLIGYTTPNFDKMNNNPVCIQVPWKTKENSKESLKKWENSETGFPAIDAAMNQLKNEGWMHHLARHLVACFLTRGDLWVSWEEGREKFEKYLVDYDWSINNFSWHWMSASAFFHQYFRVYSPVAFFKKTDKEGKYIKKHCPQLKKLPAKYIYEPWTAPKTAQIACGVVIGKDYPKPIVDHAGQ